MYQVAVVVGSLRQDSINRKLAYALMKLNHPSLAFNMAQIDDIPLYNQDLDTNLPASVVRFKQEMEKADAVLMITPEYNRSVPGVMKNLVDWGTRPYGQNIWINKVVGIIGASPSSVGTAIAQSHLRSIMVAEGSCVMGMPEVYLVHQDTLIDANHEITNEGTKKFLTGFLESFAAWIKKHK